MAEGLQRSESTFRRQGSSGLIWDDKFLQKAFNQVEAEKQLEAAQAAQDGAEPGGDTGPTMARSRSNGGGRGYPTVKVSPQVTDPPSPKVSGCGLCGAFGKPKPASSRRPRSNKQRRS